MMKTEVMPTPQQNDVELVAKSLDGNHDAFRQIVERYQTLICSLAYCATGSMSQSEDLAQETFVTAWKELPKLREPSKLRPWLCGIIRFLIGKQLRRQGREPAHAAEPMEAMVESHSLEPQPLEQAISNEELAILWRSLEKIPEIYREPLVLFYREHQSVEVVAQNLELTEDAVKQRLSRGRKLLHEEVLAFVEGALARTNPSQAFTLGVLAALPITLAASAKAATVAAAAKGGATATGTSFASVVLGILSGPALGFLFGFLGWREGLKNTRTPRERASIKRFGLIILVVGIVFFAACSLVSDCFAPRFWKSHPVLVIAVTWMVMLAWVIFAFGFTWRHTRTAMRLREEEQQLHPELFDAQPPLESSEYRSRATLFGLPLVHWRSFGKVRKPGEKIQPAIGWIACGEKAYGILYASGGIAVGGISNGGLSIGILSFGGLSVGLLAFGGFALGAVALGGGAIGWVASGGMALGWHAALGGMVAAHELACGGAALGNHVNDAVAREFFLRHRWLDFTQAGPRNLFWLLCFGPMSVQMMIGIWWRRKMEKRANKIKSIIS
jgi:RNA polymerase sigma factor (sigma-70 family)